MRTILFCLLSLALADGARGQNFRVIAGEGGEKMDQPYGLGIGPDRALYFCEIGNHRISRLDLASRRFSTYAGTGEKGYAGDGGPATAALVDEPYEIAFDKAGDLFFCDRPPPILYGIRPRKAPPRPNTCSTGSTMSDILVAITDSVATITLNRPAQMNALSASLRTALSATFADLAENDGIKIAILTGAGDRAFCAGLDLKELGTSSASPTAIIEGADDPVATLNRFRKPIIGAINGVAITGGFEVALACDVLLASANARFADTHGRVGILPGWGLSQKLSRLIGISRAKELSLTGNFIDAETAAAWGLVNRVLPPDHLLPAAQKLAADMAQMPTDMLIAYKNLIDDGYGLPFKDALALETTRGSAHNATVSAADIEARRAAVQARGRSQ